ncbi:hypothetical protein HanXRQr2_Chr02g0084361 [Helianthus annuus]|uniref:Ulp1 protease family, C-terminal catalytic domain-containing protein n=1 Tax=Helianthus annuus TaxID=4232 RepID=A0A9K3P0Z9_HELAN|nr:hypothetical protein HanXRQr2_Chr02g0084361 [Helianthus annuus]KAJ0620126.1 hypothetical protein HanHA89_Chr02g0078891 [Helianthus annuus]KAJ0787538.1 hypothetical protein HanOQP8_Chr02g0083551 [Helianthus annuus]
MCYVTLSMTMLHGWKSSEVRCFSWSKKMMLMSLKDYHVIVFLIAEHNHFYLVSFDMENIAITVIDNMDVHESPIELVDDVDYFKKTTPNKVKDIFTKWYVY